MLKSQVKHIIQTTARRFGYRIVREATFIDLLDAAPKSSVVAQASLATTDVASSFSLALPHATMHSSFCRYPSWSGMVPKKFRATFAGSLIRRSFIGDPPAKQDEEWGGIPEVGEEYFEWIDLLESVNLASERFVMVELGAGFGRWLVSAAKLVQRFRQIPFRLIAIEAESVHFQMLRQHLADNGIAATDHVLVEAAVSGRSGPIYFPQGHSEEWWGQAIVDRPDSPIGDWDAAKAQQMQSVTLPDVIRDEEIVDLIDMDIQGGEAEVIENSADVLSAKVKRVHIGTHGSDLECRIFDVFSREGWHCYQCFPCESTVQTQFGRVDFQDGIQSWINSRFTANTAQ